MGLAASQDCAFGTGDGKLQRRDNSWRFWRSAKGLSGLSWRGVFQVHL